MSGPQSTIDLVKQMTDDLKDTYETQADLVLAEMSTARSHVGDFQEWECTAILCTTFGYYSETPPSTFDKVLHWPNLTGRPHSRQGEARDELQTAEDEYNTTDEKQLSQQEKLANIPTDVGDFVTDWFDVDSEFAKVYYPASTTEIPASGGAWASQSAGMYGGSLSTQRTAADLAKDTVAGLVTNTTSYLRDVTDSVAALADLALAQEKIYVDTIKAAIQDYTSIGGFIGAIKDLITVMQDLRQLYIDEVQEQGRQLAGAVDSVIQVGILQNDLEGIGKGGKWPSATNAEENLNNPNSVASGDIRSDAEWFKAHIKYWDDIEKEMSALKTKAAGTSRLPVIMIDMPQFSAAQSTSLNGLADDLQTAIHEGCVAAGEMSEALTDTIREYINNESASAAEAEALFKEFFE